MVHYRSVSYLASDHMTDWVLRLAAVAWQCEKNILHIFSPGKDQSSKYEVEYRFDACFFALLQSQKVKPSQRRTICIKSICRLNLSLIQRKELLLLNLFP